MEELLQVCFILGFALVGLLFGIIFLSVVIVFGLIALILIA